MLRAVCDKQSCCIKLSAVLEFIMMEKMFTKRQVYSFFSDRDSQQAKKALLLIFLKEHKTQTAGEKNNHDGQPTFSGRKLCNLPPDISHCYSCLCGHLCCSHLFLL